MDNLIYLDCDGVILNTMDTAYANMKKWDLILMMAMLFMNILLM